MLNCCLNQLHGCLIPLHGCLFCPTSQASTQEVSDIRLTPPKLSPETAQGAALRPGRDWHSIPNPQSLACRSLASLRPRPPITLRSRRRRNFQKSQPPSSSSPHSASALVPATSGIYRPPPPEPCQFDVPGVAPSTSPILPERPSSVAAEDDNCAHHQTPEGRGCDSARSAQRVAVRACVVATALADSGASRGLSSHPDSLQGAQPPTTPPKQLEIHHISSPFCSIGIIAFG